MHGLLTALDVLVLILHVLLSLMVQVIVRVKEPHAALFGLSVIVTLLPLIVSVSMFGRADYLGSLLSSLIGIMVVGLLAARVSIRS